ncbi:hypothetical protein Ae201684P_010394 [Aphanomyces euteiches]|nr:hypothetical protein Ae201684P_010394 [Aphanomyces euteiches]
MKSSPSYDEFEANIRTEAARRESEIVAKRREDKRALEGNLADAAETQASQSHLDHHARRPQGPRSSNPHANEVCGYCNRRGHKTEKCFQKKKHNAEVEQAKSRAKVPEANMGHGDDADVHPSSEDVANQVDQGQVDRKLAETEWIVDTGATHHMCFVKGMFNDLQPVDSSMANSVGLPDGGKITVEGIGTVKLRVKCSATGNQATIQLNQVLYMPRFNLNLLSVPKAYAEGLRFNLDAKPGQVVLSYGDQSIVSADTGGTPLYILRHIPPSPQRVQAEANALMAQRTFDLWHRRLGHLNAHDMKRLLDKDIVRGFKVTRSDLNGWICDACELGKKSKRVKLPSVTTPADKCIAEVHSDLTGPIETPAIDGARYVCLFVDRHSGYISCYFLTKKNEFNDLLVQHRALVENKHNLPLVELHSDNGGEFLNNQLKDYCTKEGITHSMSVPYTSQQNGKVEVRFRDIFAKARSMFIDANLPKQLWDYAVDCAVYCLNRCPSGGGKQTAYELWNGHLPNLNAMRVFDSLCYVHIPNKVDVPTESGRAKAKRQKLDYKAIRGIFLGYAEDRHARQASQDIDFLFNGDTTMTALNEEEINALESFVQHFNLWDDDSGETNLVEAYGGCFQVSGLTFKATDRNLVKVSKLQAKSEELVGAEVELARAACYNVALPAASVPIPRSFQEAMASNEKDHWEAAIRKELDSIKANGTWKYVQAPEDRKPLKTTWVFRVKEKSDGTIERFKAWLVVKGFLQIKGLDYSEVFAPVMRLESLRTLLAVANAHDLPVDHMDIDTSFLNGILEDTIYIDLPEGLSVEDILDEIDWVGANPTAADVKRVACLLGKALYGLKQSPREWHKVLTAFLGEIGFEKTNVESCIYTRQTNDQLAIIAIYIDDLVLVAQNDHVMADFKSAIKQRFA